MDRWARSPKLIYRRAPGQAKFSRENPDIASSWKWGALTLGRDGSILVPTDQGSGNPYRSRMERRQIG